MDNAPIAQKDNISEPPSEMLKPITSSQYPGGPPTAPGVSPLPECKSVASTADPGKRIDGAFQDPIASFKPVIVAGPPQDSSTEHRKLPISMPVTTRTAPIPKNS
jgi:hypothetical protein